MKNPLVSVLILTFEHTDFLKGCLDSVLKSDYPNIEFIVSDNGSTEDISGFIHRNYADKKIAVVRLEKNRGLTGGFNYGYKYCKGKYILILSNDTKLASNAISEMVQMAEKDKNIGIVSPKIIQMRNPRYLHHAGSFMTYTGLLYHYGLLQEEGRKLYQKKYYVFSCNGSGFLIRKEVVEKCGLFDEDFFFYYDESDLSHRVWLSGSTIVYCPQAKIWHLWGVTIGDRSEIWYYNHRNHMSSFIRNLSLPYLVLFLVNFNIMLILWFFMKIIKFQFGKAIGLPKAYLWQLTHISENLRKRKIVQTKIRKVSDKEIFEKCLVSPGWKYYFIHLNLAYEDKNLPQKVIYMK